MSFVRNKGLAIKEIYFNSNRQESLKIRTDVGKVRSKLRFQGIIKKLLAQLNLIHL